MDYSVFLCMLSVFLLSIKDILAQTHYGFHTGNLNPPHKKSAEPQRHNNRRNSDIRTDAQRYFPSFSQIFEDGPPPFSNSRPAGPAAYYEDSIFRPSFRTQEFNQNSFREQRESFSPPVSAPSKEVGMLGSGNFGVIRGGTYYTEERDSERGEYGLDSDLFPYYDGNGHGRPPYQRGNPKPLYKNGGNFFENFRDFADITPPTKSFSEFYVVYVNKNSTDKNLKDAKIVGPNENYENFNEGKVIDLDNFNELNLESDNSELISESKTVKKGPKNILEQLAILDTSNESGEKDNSNKLSKNRRKLHEHQRKENVKESRLKARILQTPKNPYDPLLALS